MNSKISFQRSSEPSDYRTVGACDTIALLAVFDGAASQVTAFVSVQLAEAQNAPATSIRSTPVQIHVLKVLKLPFFPQC